MKLCFGDNAVAVIIVLLGISGGVTLAVLTQDNVDKAVGIATTGITAASGLAGKKSE